MPSLSALQMSQDKALYKSTVVGLLKTNWCLEYVPFTSKMQKKTLLCFMNDLPTSNSYTYEIFPKLFFRYRPIQTQSKIS